MKPRFSSTNPASPPASSEIVPDEPHPASTVAPAWADVSRDTDAPATNDSPAAPATKATEPEQFWLLEHGPRLRLIACFIAAIWATEWITTRRMRTEREPLMVQSSTQKAAKTSIAPAASPTFEPAKITQTKSLSQQNAIMVHIVGRVKNPGVYSLPVEARVRDVLLKAGGALPNADVERINLAAHLTDGEQIVLTARQTTEISNVAPQTSRIESSEPPPRAPIARMQTSTAPRKRATIVAPMVRVQFPIDLNRATIAELEVLPRVGPALAGRIVALREEKGAFRSVDELDEVKGIGEKMMLQLRPLVVVR